MNAPRWAATSRPARPPAAIATRPTSKRESSQLIVGFAPGPPSRRRHGLRVGKAVAGAAHGFDHVLAVDRTQRLAQPLDVDVDGPFLDEDVVTPDAIEQLDPEEHTSELQSLR